MQNLQSRILNKGPSVASKELPREVTTGYKPRFLQGQLHASLKRFNVLVCHRRFGKTVFAINEMIDQGLRCQHHKPRYAYIAPTYKQAKMIAWEYLLDYTSSIPGREINKSELSVSIHRDAQINSHGEVIKKADKITFILLGADSPDSLRGIYLDGCILDEYAQFDPRVWGEIVRHTLADRKGWAIFIGTPKGQNHFYDRFIKAEANEKWFTAIHRASETGIIDFEELEDMREDLTEEEAEQELECSFTAAILGSYYGKILNEIRKEGRICKVPWDRAIPVDTFWDLGLNDQTAVWFRQLGHDGYYRYIDYFEINNKSIPELVKIIKDKPYAYGRHVLPHDAKQKDWETKMSRQELFLKHGLRTEIQPRQFVADRVQASRIILRKAVFDSVNCARGLECLQNYQHEWDGKLMVFKDAPLHNWASHGSDAFGYSALDNRPSNFEQNRKNLPRRIKKDYNPI